MNSNTNAQPARAVTAPELTDAVVQKDGTAPSDDINPPRYNLLPTGEAINRVIIAGILTNIKENDKGNHIKGTFRDKTGTEISVGAGSWNDEGYKALQNATTSRPLIIVGKLDSYDPDASDDDPKMSLIDEVDPNTDDLVQKVSVESITEVSSEAANAQYQDAAHKTLNRVERMANGTTDGTFDYDLYTEAYGEDTIDSRMADYVKFIHDSFAENTFEYGDSEAAASDNASAEQAAD